MLSTKLPLIIAALVVLYVLRFVFKRYFVYEESIKMAKMEIGRARDHREYNYWRRELSALKWSTLVPFVRPSLVKGIKHSIKKRFK